MRSPPVTASRTSAGRVVLTIDDRRGSSAELTSEQARVLAAELLVAASEDASKVAGHASDAVQIAQTGHELFNHVHKVAKKNGWLR